MEASNPISLETYLKLGYNIYGESLDPRSRVSMLLRQGLAMTLCDVHQEEANGLFLTVLKRNPLNQLALMGLGCGAYNQQRYVSALNYLNTVFLGDDDGPVNDVLILIAHCLIKLGLLDRAYRTFEFALARNENCFLGLLGMAQLHLNVGKAASLRKAHRFLHMALRVKRSQPKVIGWVHTYLRCSYLREHPGMTDSASCTLTYHSLVQIGCACRASGNIRMAPKLYAAALERAPAGEVAAMMGIVQIYISQGSVEDLREAILCLRRLRGRVPDHTQVLRLLGMLLCRIGDRHEIDEAIAIFMHISERDGYRGYLALAYAYTQKQIWDRALQYYERAAQVYKVSQQTDQLPLAWTNNIACLMMYMGDLERARQCLYQVLSADNVRDLWIGEVTTLRFNYARVLEALNLVDKSKEYRKLIKAVPNYCGSYLRLGIMDFSVNQFPTAFIYFEKVLSIDPDNLEAKSYLARTMFSQGRSEEALSLYRSILNVSNICPTWQSNTKTDMGNVYLSLCRKGQDLESIKPHLDAAILNFTNALLQNAENIPANNGLAVIHCIYRSLMDASTIFNNILVSEVENLTVLWNYAILAMEQGNYAMANAIFGKWFACSYNHDVKAMTLFAVSLCKAGSEQEGIQILQRALHIAPNDLQLRQNILNLGLVIVGIDGTQER